MSENKSIETELKKRLKSREDMFLRRLFAMLAKMAKADGKVDAWETHAAERAFALFPRAAARRKFCVRVFNESKNGRKSLYRLAWEFANKWATPEDCLRAYELLWDVACATGVLKPVHKSNLEGVCKYLNLPGSYFGIYYRKRSGTFREVADSERERFQDVPPPRSKPVSALQKEYELLGCACDATDEAVRCAYRAAAKKHHPDLLRASGCSEATVQKATVKMAQINAAWEKIRKERNL